MASQYAQYVKIYLLLEAVKEIMKKGDLKLVKPVGYRYIVTVERF